MKEAIKSLWDLVYQAFEQTSHHGIEVGLAMSPDKHEVQHHLLHSVSTLKIAGAEERAMLCNQIRADVMLCQAKGWFSNDITDGAMDLLDQIQDARD